MIVVTKNGASDAIIPDSFPGFILGTKLFMFDIDADIAAQAKLIYSTYTDVDNTLLMEIERYKDISKFATGLGDIIDYAIYYNQLLTEAFFVGSANSSYIDSANAIWPVHAKKITALKGKKWPDSTFVTTMTKLDGNAISVEYPDDNMKSYSLTITDDDKEVTTSNTYPFDPNNPTYPEEFWDGVAHPTIPADASQGTCTIIYYYVHKYTTFSIMLIKGTTFSGVALGELATQGSVVVDDYKQDHVEIQVALPPTDGSSGA